jgi:hypothetical protein
MSDFRLRPRRDYAAPAYPSPVKAPPGRAPLIGNALRPFAPLAFLLVGAGALRSHGSPAVTTTSRSHALTLPQSSEKRVERLSETEITGLLGQLRAAPQRPAIRGFVSDGGVAYVTEADARKVLEAFLKKNGLAAKAVRIVRDGLDFEADSERVEIRGAADAFTGLQFEYAEKDLTEEERDEIELLRARGELRMLVLDGRAYEYDPDGDYGGRLPDLRGAVRRLLADLERFLGQDR